MVDDNLVASIGAERSLHGLCDGATGVDLGLLVGMDGGHWGKMQEGKTHVADDCAIFSIVAVVAGLEEA